MDTNNNMPKVKRESKNRIKVEFERTPLKDRLKAKFINMYFLTNIIVKIFRFVFLLGIAYIVLYPFFTKIAGSFMSPDDFVDVTVRLIPKNFTLEGYKAILTELEFFSAIKNTLIVSLSAAIIQTFICCLIGYGLAKYKFKGNNIIFLLVVLTMIIPHKTLQEAMFMKFRYFDIWGILSVVSSGAHKLGEAIINSSGENALTGFLTSIPSSIKLVGTVTPLMILSLTGLGFKNGLYIFMLRQFFRGVPDSLEESAYIDGSGNFKTFIQIILPMSVPMMITVFLFAFCWQWTDQFYVQTICQVTSNKMTLVPHLANNIPNSLKTKYNSYASWSLYQTAVNNTIGLLIISPLVVLYIFLQRYLVEGIERSGLTAE